MKRRKFLRDCSIAMAGSTVFGIGGAKIAEKSNDYFENPEDKKEIPENSADSLKKALYEDTRMLVAYFLVQYVNQEVNTVLFPEYFHGNSSTEEIHAEIRRNPFDTFLMAAVYAPILEELLFRYIPSKLLDKCFPLQRGKICWTAGITSSLLFSAVHGFKDQQGNEYIPSSIQAAGMIFWYQMRTKGFMHAVLFHGMLNGIAVGSVAINK